MASRHGACPGATPGNRTSFPQAVRQLAQQSLQNSVCSGQHRDGLPIQFSWGRGRQAMHLPCKQVYVGALPTDSTISHRGENEIQASLISSASVGATPTPATNIYIWEVIQPAVCKPAVTKQCWKMTTGAFELPVPPPVSCPSMDVRFAKCGPALPTISWICSSIRGATRCLREG